MYPIRTFSLLSSCKYFNQTLHHSEHFLIPVALSIMKAAYVGQISLRVFKTNLCDVL